MSDVAVVPERQHGVGVAVDGPVADGAGDGGVLDMGLGAEDVVAGLVDAADFEVKVDIVAGEVL